MKKHDIPKEILERVEDELLVDERLLWVGLPDSRRLMGQRSAGTDYRVKIFLLSLIGLLMLSVFATGGTSPALYISLFFLLFLSALFVPMLSRYLRGKQTVYAVTNRRAIVIEPGKVQSFGENELQHIERRKHNNGTGDIIFKTDYYIRTVVTGYGATQQRNHIAHGFFGIENPEQVEALLLENFQNDEANITRLEDRTHEGEIIHEAENLVALNQR